jgi:hypothetical protein
MDGTVVRGLTHPVAVMVTRSGVESFVAGCRPDGVDYALNINTIELAIPILQAWQRARSRHFGTRTQPHDVL